jgi:hypothetical protein
LKPSQTRPCLFKSPRPSVLEDGHQKLEALYVNGDLEVRSGALQAMVAFRKREMRDAKALPEIGPENLQCP